MTETLLSPSNVLLFGRVVEDLNIVPPLAFPPGTPRRVRAASTGTPVDTAQPLPNLDGINLVPGAKILLKDQADAKTNGIYKLNENMRPREVDAPRPDDEQGYFIVFVRLGTVNARQSFSLSPDGGIGSAQPNNSHNPFAAGRTGLPGQVEQQLLPGRKPCFARIYGFSFENVYYDLPWPTLFLVHGDGIPASEARPGLGLARAARAPGDPSLVGLGVADFQFANDVFVWSYDKADYTIRMDIENGMFEDILLDAMLGGGPGSLDSSGMNARGMNARGMNARGMNARGMNARGNSD